MGELEEKNNTNTTESTSQQQVHVSEKSKESDNNESPTMPKKIISNPTTPNKSQHYKSKSDVSKNDIKIEDDVKSINESENKMKSKKILNEEREIKPKKIPIGGLKLPGFFITTKPKVQEDESEGELLEKELTKSSNTDKDSHESKEEKPRENFSRRLRNFFARKKTKKQVTSNGDDGKSETTAEVFPSDGNPNPLHKRGLLNAIKLPITNMIPKKKQNDVELGLGKAGLASMETLDDSLKDHDCVDIALTKNNGSDEVNKPKKISSSDGISDKKGSKDHIQPVSLRNRMRSYRCSVDDVLIALSILVFVLLIGIIGYFLSNETLSSPPLRHGKYIDAVTGCGFVEGLKDDSAYAFRGIPFAVPPIGNNRWKAAKLIEGIDYCWNGTLKAHNSSAFCTQRLSNGTITGDEDCLYLDVVTPHVRYHNLLPVIVLIGAETLTGPSPGYLRPSARYARAQHVIFVRPNFRLGAFGFLALNVLSKEAYPHSSGNYALTDIIAALKWIKLNIRNFGGDPESVTLFAHRAGATLVSVLITSKEIEDLYTRAWVSSPSAVFPGKPLQESEERNQEIMLSLNCQDVECLRALTTEQIWSATPDTWLPFPGDIPTNNAQTSHEWLVLDGVILKSHPAVYWKEQQTDKTKLVIGTTAHESHTNHLRLRHTNWTAEEVYDLIKSSHIGTMNLTEDVINRYNATDYRAVVSIISDIRTICPLLTIARLQPTVPFYVVTQGDGEEQLAAVDADVQSILGRYEPHTVEQRRFVSSIQQLFYYFAAHGSVKQFDIRKRVLNIGQDPLNQEDYPNCNFWISKDFVPRYAHID